MPNSTMVFESEIRQLHQANQLITKAEKNHSHSESLNCYQQALGIYQKFNHILDKLINSDPFNEVLKGFVQEVKINLGKAYANTASHLKDFKQAWSLLVECYHKNEQASLALVQLINSLDQLDNLFGNSQDRQRLILILSINHYNQAEFQFFIKQAMQKLSANSQNISLINHFINFKDLLLICKEINESLKNDLKNQDQLSLQTLQISNLGELIKRGEQEGYSSLIAEGILKTPSVQHYLNNQYSHFPVLIEQVLTKQQSEKDTSVLETKIRLFKSVNHFAKDPEASLHKNSDLVKNEHKTLQKAKKNLDSGNQEVYQALQFSNAF